MCTVGYIADASFYPSKEGNGRGDSTTYQCQAFFMHKFQCPKIWNSEYFKAARIKMRGKFSQVTAS